MRRRRLLAAVAALGAGCLGDRREESGPRNPPETAWDGGTVRAARSLFIVDYRFDEADDGGLVVVVEVENRSASRASDTLVAAVTVDGDREEVRKVVSVEGDSMVEVSLAFETSFSEFMGGGDFTLDWD